MDFTQDVFNQPEPLRDYNLFESNAALRDALRLHAPGAATDGLSRLGQVLGRADMQAQARLANTQGPVLHTHDPAGRRIDEVEFHPAYHALMTQAVQAGLHGAPWARAEAGDAQAHVLRAAGFMLFSELEPSTLCPVSMSYAALPALRANAAVLTDWYSGLTSSHYDPRALPGAAKTGLTMGMGMTERQGGSDVRANTSRAEPDGHDAWGTRYRITGHKWFFSAPMSDAHLVLAHTPEGLSCLFLPRLLPDGRRNGVRIQRLKDKLGNRANASAEVEFDGATAWGVGEPGRGVPQILAMGALTRLDCALGTAGLMRQALALALDHARQRSAFGRPLLAQPLMRNVLADLALEAEAACTLALRVARCIDRADQPQERALARVLTPVAKFWVCKRGSAFAQEAMECLGGSGYVEEGGQGVMARIYREMPVNSIWEGSGNIMALDLLRALGRDGAAQALADELAGAQGAHPALDRAIAALVARWRSGLAHEADQAGARRLAQDLALVVQAALLWQGAPQAVALAFTTSRLGGDPGQAFGMLPAGTDVDALISRAMPR